MVDRAISKFLDSVLNTLLKWPLVLVFIYFSQELFYYFLSSIRSLTNIDSYLYIIGAVIFFISEFRYGNKCLTLEHELTHAIFCFFTFKENIRIDMNPPPESGALGLCKYNGGTNWLISLAPYFFPTLTIFISLLYLLPIQNYYFLLDLCLGYSIAFHLKTNFMEFKANMNSQLKNMQTDIESAGKYFSILILPFLNLLTFSLIFRLIS